MANGYNTMQSNAAQNAANMFAPFGEMVNHSRNYAEKSLRLMREETVEFLNRRREHTGEALAEYQKASDLAGFLAAQEKWFADLSRDCYETSRRLNEATRKLVSDGLATAAHDAEDKPAPSRPMEHRAAAE
jgi:hypothetical protein